MYILNMNLNMVSCFFSLCFLRFLVFFFDFVFIQAALILMNFVILVYVFLKLCLGMVTRTRFGPWNGLNDQSKEGFFQWSDGSAGEVYT